MNPFRYVWLVAAAALWVGCGGPFLVFPGGALSGEVVEPAPGDWSFVESSFVDLETRPSDPYSVEVNFFVKDGKLYVDPAEGRRWLDHIREDPNVRVRFDGKVYALRAVLVEDPVELEGFDSERRVHRLDPR
jgi:hypothetical protein